MACGLAPGPAPVSYCALAAALAACVCAGRTDFDATGTFTVAGLVPTLTEPVSTSKAGAWPPLAVIAVVRGGNVRRLAAADLVDVEKAGRDRGDDAPEWPGSGSG